MLCIFSCDSLYRNQDSKQFEFENSLQKKISQLDGQGEAELLFMSTNMVVHKSINDLRLFIVAKSSENELIIVSILEALYDSLSALLRVPIEKQAVLENLDLTLLIIDEIIDNGLILETDANTIASRVAMVEEGTDHTLAEQTISQAFATAREQYRNFLR